MITPLLFEDSPPAARLVAVGGAVSLLVVTEAFKRSAIRTDKDIPVLSEYVKILRVETKLRDF